MSDLSNQAQKLLDGFCQTVDRMKSAYSRVDAKMSVWVEDLYAVEAVMSFLETIRDVPAQEVPPWRQNDEADDKVTIETMAPNFVHRIRQLRRTMDRQ